jgi:hypothetical protein
MEEPRPEKQNTKTTPPPHSDGAVERDNPPEAENQETPERGRGKGKRSAKKDALGRQTGKQEPYAYTIKDNAFEPFHVLNTANGWWIDKTKVDRLITAFKLDCTIQEACVYAGISIRSYQYFNELHPDFCNIIDACRQLPSLKARETVVKKMAESYANAVDYLKRKKKDEFGDSLDHTTGGERINQNVITFVDFSRPEEKKDAES